MVGKILARALLNRLKNLLTPLVVPESIEKSAIDILFHLHQVLKKYLEQNMPRYAFDIVPKKISGEYPEVSVFRKIHKPDSIFDDEIQACVLYGSGCISPLQLHLTSMMEGIFSNWGGSLYTDVPQLKSEYCILFQG